MKRYNKLVRDKIPEIIRAGGEKPVTRVLDDDAYLRELVKKLGEEYEEFKAAVWLDELADIQEVVLALADTLASRAKLEEVRRQKAQERGAFSQRIFLDKVEQNKDDSDIYKAGGIIIQDRKTLVERSIGKEFFIIPGGQIETGETARQALVRELKEEVSIEVDEDDLEPFGSFSAKAANHPGRTVHIEQFLVKKWRGQIKPDSEVEELRWITSKLPDDMKIGSIFAHDVIPRLKKLDLID